MSATCTSTPLLRLLCVRSITLHEPVSSLLIYAPSGAVQGRANVGHLHVDAAAAPLLRQSRRC